ncbi:MAG: tetratricopeptide repeat protein [Rhodospirillales bacterium]
MVEIRSESDIQAALSRVETCLGEERPRDAIADLQAILAAFPNHPMALCGVGRVSIQLGDNAAALQALDIALAGAPDHAESRNARGAALQNLGRLEEAEAEFRRVADALPGHPGPLLNLAATLAAQGLIEDAEKIFNRVLEINPEDPTSRYNLGLLQLLKGEFSAGWQGFECRQSASNVGLAKIRSTRPQWQGEPVPDGTLLIHAEQGLGDNIQFSRFVRSAAERVGQVILEVPETLKPLFEDMPGVAQVFTKDMPLPDHDLFIPIMSLPAVLGIDEGDDFWTGAYVRAEPAAVQRWRERVEQRLPGPLHVGLIWSGNPSHKRDAERSVPLSVLEPLLDVPGVSLHSLQIGPAMAQIEGTVFSGPMKMLFRRAYPFSEVAAAVSALDLIIGVDTSLIHLAGAMERPVWTMITHVPDWRWMLGRDDSPWYPSMRLFRQPNAGDWPAVAQDLALALAEFASEKS